MFRDRWYWSDHRVSQATRTWRLVYQPLTSSYRVTYGGLSQSYASRAEALAAVSRSARWKIADTSQVPRGRRPLRRVQLSPRHLADAAADADRPRRAARMDARRQADAALQLTTTAGRARAAANAPHRLAPPGRAAEQARHDQAGTLGLDRRRRRRHRRGAGARVPAVDRHQQPGALRAPLRVAVLGQRGGGDGPAHRHHHRRRAPAAAGVARQVRQPPAAQAGGDLRAGGRGARRADLHRELPVRLAHHRELVRRARRGRARVGPQARPRHARRLVADLATKTRLAAERLGEAGALGAARARAHPRTAVGAGGRHPRLDRADPAHDQRHRGRRLDARAPVAARCCARPATRGS